ncbi:MAG: hypothetical protein GXP55_22680 [Deltaproteobacteria bacterium]|nr:hypothetical protein [Deltaproteobacteria bacterium]
MFKNLLKELERLKDGATLSIPIEADERGYLDKECPGTNCGYEFKVLEQDWIDLLRDEEVFCPMCGHAAPADRWWTTEQIEKGRELVIGHVESRFDKAMRQDADTFNRQQRRGGLLRVSLNVSGTERQAVMVALRAADILDQCITCPICEARYAILGPAFFCPCCGHNSVERMFISALENVRAKAGQLDTIRQAISLAANRDTAESLCRSILESGIGDCVVAFQHFANTCYARLPEVTDPPLNVFQRLEQGGDLWRSAVGKSYDDWLSAAELSLLKVLFQRRHLLAHRDGIIDDKYIRKTGDLTYKIGQRLVVVTDDVVRMADLTEKLGGSLLQVTAGSERAVGRAEADGTLDHESPRAFTSTTGSSAPVLRTRRLRDRVLSALEGMADDGGVVTSTLGELFPKAGGAEYIADVHQALIQLKDRGDLKLYIEGGPGADTVFEVTLLS